VRVRHPFRDAPRRVAVVAARRVDEQDFQAVATGAVQECAGGLFHTKTGLRGAGGGGGEVGWAEGARGEDWAWERTSPRGPLRQRCPVVGQDANPAGMAAGLESCPTRR